MALVNQAMHEINAKVVYFGPGLAGKATTLKYIYGKLKPEFRGKLKAMNVQGGRMLFFDFTPPGEGKVRGYRVRVHVYTMSGETVDPAAWKVALKGADGIVFMADASADRIAANSRSLEELEAALSSYGMTLGSKPVVFQYNKSETDRAVSKEDLDRLINPSGFPSFTSSSTTGVGVLQTLLALVKSIFLKLRADKGLIPGEPAEETPVSASEPEKAPFAESVEPSEPVASHPPESFADLSIEQPPAAASSFPEPDVSVGAPVEAAPPEAAEEELSVEVAAEIVVTGSGRLSIPLVIRSGARSKPVTLNVALSLEER